MARIFNWILDSSPDIKIFLLVNDVRIELADILNDTARLDVGVEFTEIPPKTLATIVISINGEEQKQNIELMHGLNKGNRIFSFKQLKEQDEQG